MTISDPTRDARRPSDASDIVTGPIGSAHLREPAPPGPAGVDLDRLPAIEVAADDQALMPSASGPSSLGYDPNGAVRQLEAIIQNLSTHATPVLREIAARAAELAAKAGAAAGPLAHKAASVTEEVGGRVATKGLEVAAELRRDQPDRTRSAVAGAAGGPGTAVAAEPAADHQSPPAVEAGLPSRT
jgi:hypothetical protein